MDSKSFQRTALTPELAQLQRRTLTTELAELERTTLTPELAELEKTALHIEHPALKQEVQSFELRASYCAALLGEKLQPPQWDQAFH